MLKVVLPWHTHCSATGKYTRHYRVYAQKCFLVAVVCQQLDTNSSGFDVIVTNGITVTGSSMAKNFHAAKKLADSRLVQAGIYLL